MNITILVRVLISINVRPLYSGYVMYYKLGLKH